MTDAYVSTFETWEAFVEAAQRPTRWRNADQVYCRKTEASSHWAGEDWHGTATFEEAVHRARYGWPEGRERMSDAIAIVSPQRQSVRSYGRDVAGERPLVHLAIAGDPMCMALPRATHAHGTPVVRIDYACSVPAYVSGAAVLNRGAALLSIVDRLEERGYSCELRIVMHSKGAEKTQTTIVAYKHAGEPLDIDLAAFAMTSPAVQRRFGFAIIEQNADLERDRRFAQGHGHSTKADETEEGVIFVARADDADEEPGAARQRMEAVFAEYLER